MTEYKARSFVPAGTPSGDPRSSAKKPTSKSQALGQVFTSESLALQMIKGIGLDTALPNCLVLDPCVGPNTFPNIIRKIRGEPILINSFDVDPEMCRISESASDESHIVECADYLLRPLKGRFDFVIMNPPYVRQEWIVQKPKYRAALKSALNIDVPGTANLYVYFLVKALADLKQGGRLACIVYDSWQSTKYGRWLRQQLDELCSSWRVETAPPLPFDGRLIDATIIYAEKGHNKHPRDRYKVRLNDQAGLAMLNELFRARRGLRLKQTDFFVTDLELVAKEDSTPFVKKISKIRGYCVPKEHPEAALLVSEANGSQKTISTLNGRLSRAIKSPDKNVSILTWYRERPDKWYLHNTPPNDALLFNYYLRHRPRHILNQDQRAYSDNFYGITPNDGDFYGWLAALNATASVAGIMRMARNQGAGLAKLQLYEYRDARVLDIRDWTKADRSNLAKLGQTLAAAQGTCGTTLSKIDDLVYSVLGTPEFEPSYIQSLFQEADSIAKKPSRKEI